ncbi:MAG TPA: SagB family peptide dehydrogenase [Burkholderiaceae bacterium]|nr:SagB family peptide dehydrogenase [Burkholderiaceae bacterium]
MPKLAWVSLPVLVYAAGLAAWMLLRGRRPSRQDVNLQLSLLLMLYLAATAGLGLFWVARQQLPVFDWHYLFGYGTLALALIHLYFNLPAVWRALRRPRQPAPLPQAGRERGRGAGVALAMLAALAAAYWLGAGQQAPPRTPLATLAPASPNTGAVLRFHAYSSESRRQVLDRAPAIDWGQAPPAFKAYPAAAHIRLSRGDVGRRGLSAALRGAEARAAELSLPELGDLLYLSAGVTERRAGGRALRAAPSAGALFSGELYVLARAVQGLAPGLYHYDADHERLDVLGPLPADSGVPSADDADAAIVLTSVIRRTAYKYGDRAYRYVAADGGHLLENLRVASQSAGMQATLAARFDEGRLAHALGVDGAEEIVLAVMALRRAPSAPSAPPPAWPPRYAELAAAPAPATGVTGLVQQATSLRLASGEADDAPGASVALPAPQASEAPLRQVIVARRSKRRYTDEPVPLAALAGILDDLAQPDQLSGAVRISLVVNRVQGLAPGIYRYDRRRALQRVRAGAFAAAAESAALSQSVIGDAAVVLVLSVDQGAMLAEGARGYRHGLIETGLIGERWLLGAVARRLGACPVGAFYDDEAAALINADQRREWVLHFAALGVPAGE